MQNFPKRDWTTLIPIREKALQRQCQKSLNEVQQLIESNPNGLSPQGLYLEVYKLVNDNNKIIARDFDDWRRSTASLVLAGWLVNGVLKKEEFELLSTETKEEMMIFHKDRLRFFKPEAKMT